MFQILFFLFIVRPFLIFFIGLRVYGRQNLPQKHPFVIIANHSSHLDVVTLLNLFPLKELKNIRPVAAADYFTRNKIVSFITGVLFNILPIPRKNITRENNPVDLIKNVLCRGKSIIIFPEGTRSLNGEISHFHSGIVHFMKDYSDIPVMPIYLSNIWKSLPKGEWIPLPFFCDVIIGEPIYFKNNRMEFIELLEKSLFCLKEKYEKMFKLNDNQL